MIDEGVGDGLGWDGHLGLLHSSKAFRRAAVTSWARRGLEQGAKIVHAEAADGDATHGVFGRNGVDAAGNGQGRLQALAREEFYVPTAQAKWVDAALEEGYSSMWLLASRAGALTVLSRRLRRVRAGDEALCASRPVSVLCSTTGPRSRGRVCMRQPTGTRRVCASCSCTRPRAERSAAGGAGGLGQRRPAGQCAARGDGADRVGVGWIGRAVVPRCHRCRALVEGTAGFAMRVIPAAEVASTAVHRVLRLLGIHQQHGLEMAEPE